MDFYQVKTVRAVATQGYSYGGTSSYCQTYILSHSKSGAIWELYKENNTVKVKKKTRIRTAKEFCCFIGLVGENLPPLRFIATRRLKPSRQYGVRASESRLGYLVLFL